MCVQKKTEAFSGRIAHRARSRKLVAWAARGKETELLKPADKVRLGRMSEFPGRSASERAELLSKTYRPLPNRRKEIPKGNGKVRVLGIPTIRDRVVQGALTLILEPIFEADFQDGSFGYRPRRSAHQAIARVSEAIRTRKTQVIDVDLKGYFDNVRHHILMEKAARRVSDPDILHLLKMILRASGKKGVPQGGVVSPLLSNLYLNEVDTMLERAKEVT